MWLLVTASTRVIVYCSSDTGNNNVVLCWLTNTVSNINRDADSINIIKRNCIEPINKRNRTSVVDGANQRHCNRFVADNVSQRPAHRRHCRRCWRSRFDCHYHRRYSLCVAQTKRWQIDSE